MLNSVEDVHSLFTAPACEREERVDRLLGDSPLFTFFPAITARRHDTILWCVGTDIVLELCSGFCGKSPAAAIEEVGRWGGGAVDTMTDDPSPSSRPHHLSATFTGKRKTDFRSAQSKGAFPTLLKTIVANPSHRLCSMSFILALDCLINCSVLVLMRKSPRSERPNNRISLNDAIWGVHSGRHSDAKEIFRL